MFDVSRRFDFKLTNKAKLSIITAPQASGHIQVTVNLHRTQNDKTERRTGTVFLVHPNFTHYKITDAPFTCTDENETSDLNLENYRLFKNNVLAALTEQLNIAREKQETDRTTKLDILKQIITKGMRHPDETVVKRGLLGLVKK